MFVLKTPKNKKATKTTFLTRPEAASFAVDEFSTGFKDTRLLKRKYSERDGANLEWLCMKRRGWKIEAVGV